MMVLGVVGAKGGCGKTQASVHLAAHAARQRRVALIDLDPTHQSLNWITSASIPVDATALDLSRTDLGSYLRAVAREGYELAVVDTPANDLNTALEALLCCTFAVIPLGVGTSDLGMLATTARIVERAQRVHTFPARVLINRAGFAPSRTNRTREAVEAFGLKLFDSQIPLLGCYQEAAGNPITSAQHHYSSVLGEIYAAAEE